jgi:hypothetical protein
MQRSGKNISVNLEFEKQKWYFKFECPSARRRVNIITDLRRIVSVFYTRRGLRRRILFGIRRHNMLTSRPESTDSQSYLRTGIPANCSICSIHASVFFFDSPCAAFATFSHASQVAIRSV